MYIDHVGINTNDMEATLQFYCGILGMRLVRTTRTPDGRRHYNVEIRGGNAICRMVDASEVAFVAVFLASEKAWAVSGELVAASGGAGRTVFY